MATRSIDELNHAPPGAPPTAPYVYVPSLGKYLPTGATDNGDGTATPNAAGVSPLTHLPGNQYTVGVTQVAVPTTNLTGRKTISVQALGANAANVYVGLTGVTASTGWELSAGASIDLDLADSVQLYAIAASGSQKVGVIEIG